MRFLILFFALLIAWPAAAQSSGTTAPVPAATPPAVAPSAPALRYDGWVFSASAEGYITYNGNHPASGANQLYNYNTRAGQPELSLAKVVIDKSDQIFGLHVTAGFGEEMRLIHAADPAAIDHRALRYLEQAYVIVKPHDAHGAEFDFGQFDSSAGVEAMDNGANWNYSHSLLFAWAIPAYHFGFRSNLPITKEFSAGFQLVNAWNTVWGNNELTNVGVVTALTKPKYTWSLNYFEGPNHSGTKSGKRNLVDTSLQLTPAGKLGAYISFDYGQENRIDPHAGHDSWIGVAGAARFQLAKKIAIASRAEWFDDRNGLTTGLAQNLKEITLTGEYRHSTHFLGRLEFRHDWSDKRFFERGSTAAAKTDLNTLTLGVIVSAGPFK